MSCLINKPLFMNIYPRPVTRPVFISTSNTNTSMRQAIVWSATNWTYYNINSLLIIEFTCFKGSHDWVVYIVDSSLPVHSKASAWLCRLWGRRHKRLGGSRYQMPTCLVPTRDEHVPEPWPWYEICTHMSWPGWMTAGRSLRCSAVYGAPQIIQLLAPSFIPSSVSLRVQVACHSFTKSLGKYKWQISVMSCAFSTKMHALTTLVYGYIEQSP